MVKTQEERMENIEKRLAMVEKDIEYILKRLGEIMLAEPNLAKRTGFALGTEKKVTKHVK